MFIMSNARIPFLWSLIVQLTAANMGPRFSSDDQQQGVVLGRKKQDFGPGDDPFAVKSPRNDPKNDDKPHRSADQQADPPVRDQRHHGAWEMQITAKGDTVLRKVEANSQAKHGEESFKANMEPANKASSSEAKESEALRLHALGGQSLHVSRSQTNQSKQWQINAMDRSGLSHTKAKSELGPRQSFEEWAPTIPWRSLFGNVGNTRDAKHEQLRINVKDQLTEYVEQEHPSPLKPCPTAIVDAVTDEDCTNTGVLGSDHVFKGPRQKKAFLIDVSIFGFELDMIEMKLHELNQTVDLFAIIEMPVTHKGHSKPLVWNRNKDLPRFAPFKDRILHLVVDPKIDDHTSRSFVYEHTQEKLGVQQLKEMLEQLYPETTNQEVLLNFGDVDEISHPRSLALMKHCEPKKMPVDTGALMVMSHFSQIFQPKHPVNPELPYAYGNPTLVALEDAELITEKA